MCIRDRFSPQDALTIMQMGAADLVNIKLMKMCIRDRGVVIEKIAYTPLRNAPRISLLITAIGVSFFLEYLSLIHI